MNLVGDVDGCDAIIVDDMIDTAGTLVQAARAIKDFQNRRVLAVATRCTVRPAISNFELQRSDRVSIQFR